MRLLLFAAASVLSGCICVAQSVSIGVRGGARVTADLSGDALSESKRYLAGPMVELSLPFGLGAEVDALYSREGYRASSSNFAGTFDARERASVWQFPMVAKYRFPFPLVKPVVLGGYSTRVMNGTLQANGVNIDPSTGARTPYSLDTSEHLASSHGFVLGGGVQVGIGGLHVSPEIRYTRWSSSPIRAIETLSGSRYASSQNEIAILVGISWKVF
jgi:hypothetical protein